MKVFLITLITASVAALLIWLTVLGLIQQLKPSDNTIIIRQRNLIISKHDTIQDQSFTHAYKLPTDTIFINNTSFTQDGK